MTSWSIICPISVPDCLTLLIWADPPTRRYNAVLQREVDNTIHKYKYKNTNTQRCNAVLQRDVDRINTIHKYTNTNTQIHDAVQCSAANRTRQHQCNTQIQIQIQKYQYKKLYSAALQRGLDSINGIHKNFDQPLTVWLYWLSCSLYCSNKNAFLYTALHTGVHTVAHWGAHYRVHTKVHSAHCCTHCTAYTQVQARGMKCHVAWLIKYTALRFSAHHITAQWIGVACITER